ncbi:Chemotaxis protein methyltransferase CheR [Acidisarcina polymorpha]|uniref:protein-glutamate O-methyltransferase n=1 Tax=Acidisarcina polymorpha TaxID=2211140 RepID=A0A2Z5G1E9_9BACT|nr:protein-glutamate O-methyltransferase CheR [Acidisarcina polymorpha]AXC12892.1 Chemotaxis protein methyltransferase CheR [Acidisarcina polymorpha]
MSVTSVKSSAVGPPVPQSVSAVKNIAISSENYKYLQQEIYRESGIVLDEDKHYLLESRLMPVARAAQMSSLDELCTRLRAKTSPGLARSVIEALTTNETLFFRDMAPFEALRLHMLPELLAKKPQKLAIWSAAASSGQEAYSIAMLIKEYGIGGCPVDILGTDLSEQILERAREAKYVQFEVNRGLPAAYLVKYFKREGLDWQLKADLRAMVKFKRFDLRQSMLGLGKFDIVFCRNVLIYFDVDTKVKILTQILSVLNPGGFLLLGGAETTLNLHDKFERIAVGSTVVYRKG